MTTSSPLTQIDFYKADHRNQYPEGTSLVFSNFTPRGSRLPDVDEVTAFGLQYFTIEYLVNQWNKNFFGLPKDEVVGAYRRRMENAGIDITYEHVEALHDLGYLPLEIKAVPEGTKVPMGVPMLVMWNTLPEFFWLTNYLETILSTTVWGPTTSATIAGEYRKILDAAAAKTGGSPEFVDFQGHDFSARGMFGHEASMLSGAGHLVYFKGTDTVAALDFLDAYYDGAETFLGGSVPATEHSVMCMGTQEDEAQTYRRLITETYPGGIVSIVSDTWDYWRVWTNILPELKEDILARDGTVTIRPDSGDPVEIICGDPNAAPGTPEHKGSFEMAWDLFGGTVTPQGYRQLDSHINLIYGDSITIDRCRAIVNGLIRKGFVPSMIFGIGSFTYQYNTRDTLGFAMKATYGEVNGEPREIFKDPKTDSGTKRSARGLLSLYMDDDKRLALREMSTWEEVNECEYWDTVFRNGEVVTRHSIAEIRERANA